MARQRTAAGQLVLVEDDPSMRGVLTVLLESVGWEVLPAEDGKSALKATRRAHPDLVLTDLRMPGMTGIELAQEIAGSPSMPEVPVVAITSDTSGLRAAALRSGRFVDVLTKPIAPDDLLEALRRALPTDGDH